MAFVVLAGGRAFWEIYSAGGRCRCRTQLRRAPATWTAWQIVIPAAIVLLAIGARARDRRLIAVALGIAGLSLVRQIPLGARVTPLPMVGGGLIILYLLRDRRPRAISVAISACVALVVSATLLAARTPEDRRNRSFGAIVVDNVRAPGQVLRPLTTGGDAEMAPALAAALTVVPKETGYRYGFAIVGDLFSRPIPRSVWPGRPAPPREAVMQMLVPFEYRIHAANIEFSALLVFFMDFGVVGVVLGLFAYGCCASAVFAFYKRHRDVLLAQVVLAIFVPFTVIGLRDGFVDTTIRAVWLFAPVALIFRVATPAHGLRPRPAAPGASAQPERIAASIRRSHAP